GRVPRRSRRRGSRGHGCRTSRRAPSAPSWWASSASTSGTSPPPRPPSARRARTSTRSSSSTRSSRRRTGREVPRYRAPGLMPGGLRCCCAYGPGMARATPCPCWGPKTSVRRISRSSVPCSSSSRSSSSWVDISPEWYARSGKVSTRAAPIAAQERERRLHEAGRRVPEHRTMAATGDHPQVRPGDRRVQLEGEGHRVQRIAVAEDDQGLRRDGRQVRRREVDVVVAVREAARDLEELLDLRLAAAMTLPHALHLGASHHRFRELPLDRARLG